VLDSAVPVSTPLSGAVGDALLWSGIRYVFYYEIALMFGCASLPGTDPDQLAMRSPISTIIILHRPSCGRGRSRSVMSYAADRPGASIPSAR